MTSNLENGPITSITGHFERNTFPVKEASSILPVNVELNFQGRVPISVEVGDKKYRVESYVRDYTAQEFFSNTVRYKEDGTIESISFYNNTARDYVEDLVNCYIGEQKQLLRRTALAEMELASDKAPGSYSKSTQKGRDSGYVDTLISDIENGENYRDLDRIQAAIEHMFDPKKPLKTRIGEIPENGENWMSEYQQKVVDWINELRASETAIRYRRLTVKLGNSDFSIRRVSVGEIDTNYERDFNLDKNVIGAVLYAADTLGIPPRRAIAVFDTSVFERTPQGYKNPVNEFLGASGRHTWGSTIYVNSRSMYQNIESQTYDPNSGEITLSGKNVINERQYYRTTVHETAHVLDPYSKYATRPVMEGFASAFDCGFRFDRAVRHIKPTDPEVTMDKLLTVYSAQPPETLTGFDRYSTPAAFNCWLYEHLGPDNFMQFTANVCGVENNLKDKKRKVTEHSKELKGDLIKSLDALPHDHRWTWQNSGELVMEFLRDLDERREKKLY